MHLFIRIVTPCCAALLAAVPMTVAAADARTTPLHDTIAALDAAVFDAFNHCSDGTRLQEHATYFAPDVEFYHDTGGVTRTREAMIANTAKHACGRYTRKLVEGSLQVHPIAGFGALSLGVHRFCQSDSSRCEGEADFAMLWHLRDDRQWEITRVLSYGHRSSPTTP